MLVAIDSRSLSPSPADVTDAVRAGIASERPDVMAGALPSGHDLPDVDELLDGLDVLPALTVWADHPSPEPTRSWTRVESRTVRDKGHYRIFTDYSAQLAQAHDDVLSEVLARRDDLGSTVLGGGEINLVKLRKRDGKEFEVPGELDRLLRRAPTTILNLLDRFPRRWEVKEKLRYVSLEYEAHVLSVWNQSRPNESARPWSYFHLGQQKPIRELPAHHPSVRLGVVEELPGSPVSWTE